jgi:methionyl-tRNA formyltransferase
LKTLKPEGKKEMPAADFLNGLRLKPGDLLR